LNVFTARRCVLGLVQCPVIFYVLGGDWQFGTPSKYFDEQNLIDIFAVQGVIFVSVSYRVASFASWRTPVGVRDGVNGNYVLYGNYQKPTFATRVHFRFYRSTAMGST
jgi:hypothetical protein